MEAAKEETSEDCFSVKIIGLPFLAMCAQVEDGRVVRGHVLVLETKLGVRTGELVLVLDKVLHRLLGDRAQGHEEQGQVLDASVDEELGELALVLVEPVESQAAAGETAETHVAAGRARQWCRCVSQADQAARRVSTKIH